MDCHCGLDHLSEVRYVNGGIMNGRTEYTHICGIHISGHHDHGGYHGTIGKPVSDALLQNGLYSHTYDVYLIACEAVDNFVTATYTGTDTYLHGHPLGQPCHCWELGLE